MKKFTQRTLGLLLVLAMLAIQLMVAPIVPTAQAATTTTATTAASSGLSIQDGVTLHCWNWSFANIEKQMATIASQGYTAVQVSPIQQAKQNTKGYSANDWWVFYQPASFSIDNTGNSALGTKAEFTKMCATAEQYGIKVIVDVVANHTGNGNSGRGIASTVIADLRNDSSCWHDINTDTWDYNNRYNITQYCMNGLPDLNTSNTKVQNYVLNFLKECWDAGADGFRFDAAKHIETPEDPGCGSNFWPNVINGIKSYAPGVYVYGELLDSLGEGMPDSNYTKYMSITDNTWGNAVRNNVVNGSNAGAYSYGFHKGAKANQLVIWAESHDTYAGEGTSSVSVQNINKTWALVAARADAMGLYLARPNSLSSQKLGDAAITGWSYPEVGAVNKFHNHFAGQGEWVSNENGIAYVERGTSGVVLVNCNGSNSVNVTANAMANGTYIDQITGNKFTVSNGRITGTIGSTGIAVVYNAVTCDHESHNISGVCTSCNAKVSHTFSGDTCTICGYTKPADKTIYFDNSNNWSTVYIYTWNEYGDEYTGTWPGKAMTKVSGTIYSCTVSGEATNVIFHNNTTDTTANKTADLDIPTGADLYTMSTGKWTSYNTCSHSWGTGTVTKDATCTATGVRTYTCSKCSQTKTESIAALGHSYSTATVTKEPTCTATGTKTATCATCGQAVTESIAALGHSYGSYTVTKEATCTATGTKTATCATCGNTKSETIAATGHTYVGGKCTGCGVAEPTDQVIYFKNTSNWSTVNIYYWSDSNSSMVTWPGKGMSLISGNIYGYTLPADAEYVIFNDGSSQTDDLTIPTDGKNLYTLSSDSWSTYTAPAPKTIYFKNSSNWSTVYIYAWDDNNAKYTGTWPGSAMKKVDGETDLYYYEVSSEAVNVIFNNNSGTQTGDLTIPTDSKNLYTYSSNSWSTYTTECAHSYTEKVTTAATCTTAGVKTFTCSSCGDSYTEAIAKLGHSYSSAVTAPTCTAQGYTTHTCAKCGDTYKDSYTAVVDHSYSSAVTKAPTCSAAGVKTFTCSGCGDSYTESMAKLSHTLVTDAAKAPTCTETGLTEGKHCSACGTVTVAQTVVSALGHSYADGICGTCGEADPDYVNPIVQPVITVGSPSVSFEGEIRYNIYFSASQLDDVTEMGLALFNTKVADGTVENADQVIPGYTGENGSYMVQTDGIAPKNMGDALYFRIYAKLTDGSYVYTDIRGYNAIVYANNILKNSTDANMRSLVVAMLNYGAAAQQSLNYKTDSLMNAGLTAEHQALVKPYDADMMDDLVSVSSVKVGKFAYNAAGFSGRKPSVSFDGAFAINYYFTTKFAPENGMKLYYWTLADYNACGVLTAGNATGSMDMTDLGNNQFWGNVEDIVAKNIDETVFVAAVYTYGGVEYATGVLAYSVGSYCESMIAAEVGSATQAMTPICSGAAVYGYYAKEYFNALAQ